MSRAESGKFCRIPEGKRRSGKAGQLAKAQIAFPHTPTYGCKPGFQLSSLILARGTPSPQKETLSV